MDEDWVNQELFTLHTGDARVDERGKKILSDFAMAWEEFVGDG